MTEAEKRGCERLAASLAATGRGHPLIVPPSMFEHLKREGVDVTNMRASRPLPLR